MKISALILLATTLALSLPTEARVGSSGGRSSSSSSSSSSHANSSPSAAPARAGGGNSVGMQRSDTVNNAKATGGTTYNGKTQPPPTANSGSQYPNGVNPHANYQGNTPPAPGYVRNSAGSWVLPALAGAAAGYAISQAISSPQQPAAINNNGGVAGQNGSGGSHANGEPMSAPASSGGMGFMGGLLILALLGGVLYFAFRFFKQRQQRPVSAATGATMYQTPWTNPTNNPLEAIGEEVKSMASAFYARIQALNNAGDLHALQSITTPDVYKALADDIQHRSEPSRTEVVRIETRLLDVSEEGGQIIASVQYTGAVREGFGRAEEQVDEVYHFVKPKFGGNWKLAGIEN